MLSFVLFGLYTQSSFFENLFVDSEEFFLGKLGISFLVFFSALSFEVDKFDKSMQDKMKMTYDDDDD